MSIVQNKAIPVTFENVSIKWGVLKQTYNVIVTYCNKLGEHWDNQCGANISRVLVVENWAKYIAVKANVHMKLFHNKGWEYLEYMEDIFPQGGATGAHAFCAGASNIPAANTNGSNASGTTPIPPPSVSDSIPISLDSLAIDSNAITSDPPASEPLTSASGGKRSFNMMSTDVTDTAPLPSSFRTSVTQQLK
ncbi:hypothetical protein EDD15DRAFT_2372113 [Pisolithus albus]|nr:hypothetical protein EDD15DRAFT_2372113 [Pisolithus albus]